MWEGLQSTPTASPPLPSSYVRSRTNVISAEQAQDICTKSCYDLSSAQSTDRYKCMYKDNDKDEIRIHVPHFVLCFSMTLIIQRTNEAQWTRNKARMPF